MTITFAGTVIGQDTFEGGTDGIEGFEPTGKQTVQVAQYLRGTDAVPIARGNRVHTLKGTIHQASYASSAQALVALLQRYAGLPTSGALKLSEDGYSVTFPIAVLETFEAQRDGCSYSITISFTCGAPNATAAPQPLVADAGTPIPTDAGAPIVENPAS